MTVLKRKDKDGVGFGNYRISIYIGKDKSGKKEYYWETFKGNSKQAKDRETELRYQVKKGKFFKPSKLTVSDFMDKWLKDYSEVHVSPYVHERYESIVNVHIKPELGEYALTQLTKPEIAEFYSKCLKSGLKAQTVKHYHALLHKTLETAIVWGLLDQNVSEGIELPKVEKPEMNTYDPQEVNQFLETAKTSPYYCLYFTAFHEGLRQSEILGLRWKDIDLTFGTVSVNRAMHILKKSEINYRNTKTAKSNRNIPFTPSSYLVMKEHYDKCKANEEKGGLKVTNESLVFCDPQTGEPYKPSAVTKAWTEIARIAKLKHIRFHDARHTMATIMLKQGIHPKIVQERLGHASIQITLDTYSHIVPSMQQAAAKSFDEAFKIVDNKKVEIT